MKKKVFKLVSTSVLIFCLFFSCQKEINNETNAEFNVIEAKNWFESNFNKESLIGPKGSINSKLCVKLNWNLAICNKLKDSRTVEIPLSVFGEFGFADEESYKIFKLTRDIRYRVSNTILVIEKKMDITRGFYMTVIPNKTFREESHFNALKSTYKKWQQGFTGSIVYHNINGKFSNGWRFENGIPVGFLKQIGKNNLGLQLSKGCIAYYHVHWELDCSQMTKSECIYTESWDLLWVDCDGGSGGIQDDGSYWGSSSPCNGDPIANVSIAATTINGDPITGMYGCVRPGVYICTDKRIHNGIDISADQGTEVNAMRDGIVVDFVNIYAPGDPGDGTSRGNWGNYIKIRKTFADGSTTDILYAHLNYISNSIYVGQQVEIGEVIGLSGTTGNAYNVPNPHIHIEVFQDGINADPSAYFSTYISPTGTVSDPCIN